MKTKRNLIQLCLLGTGLLTAMLNSFGQDARFFRITGPAATTITTLRPDGTLVWSNALADTNYIVQTVTALPGGTNWVDYVQLPVTNRVNTNLLVSYYPPAGMALIPAGSFTMGDSLDSDSSALPLHTVYVSAFYMDKYDVTKAQWDNVYSWAITHGYSFDYAGSGKAANHPVQSIDWYDSVKWCNARSEMEKRTPAYYTNAAQTTVYRTGRVNVDNSSVKWDSGYQLPTEAEWEKAARGGLSGQRFPWGNTISWSQANYYGKPLSLNTTYGYAYDFASAINFDPMFNDGVYPLTSPVGYFAPNGYGLYDMAGDVWQWCWDWYGTYSSNSQTDPRGAVSDSGRVLRGGDWGSYAIRCRTAVRDACNPTDNGGFGFRSVLPSGQ